MSTWIAALVLVVVVAAAITVKLLVRRRAPMAGWFADPARAAGTLSVIGTMFAVMLAFVIFLALQSYQRARQGSSVEAIAVTELHSVAAVFQPPTSDRLQGELVCYGRAVIEDEWPAMRKGRSSELVQSWIDRLGRRVRDRRAPRRARGNRLRTVVRRAGATPRRSARAPRRGDPVGAPPAVVRAGHRRFTHDRLHVAQADRREGVLIQSIPIGFVTALATAGMLVVFFLDHPYTNESGSIAPTEMRRTLTLIDHGSATPCDERGIPRS